MQIKELFAALLRRQKQHPEIPVLPVQLDEIQWLLKRDRRLAKSDDKR